MTDRSEADQIGRMFATFDSKVSRRWRRHSRRSIASPKRRADLRNVRVRHRSEPVEMSPNLNLETVVDE